MEPNALAEPVIMNEEQAAHFLGKISLKHLYNLRCKAGLPFVRIGARIMYRRESLLRWIAERELVVTTS